MINDGSIDQSNYTVGSSRKVELSAAIFAYSSEYVIAFPGSISGGDGGPFPLPNTPGSCCGELRGGSVQTMIKPI